MYKLTVVGGPNKGTSFPMPTTGELTIGRIAGNGVVLNSPKVSKKHCVLAVTNGDVTVRDAGSSNGTFVNGILTKSKKLSPGDRVSVGDFVLELTRVQLPAASAGGALAIGDQFAGVPPLGGGAASAAAAAAPKDPGGKLKFYFDKYVVNVLYNLNETYEWRVMLAALIGLLTFAASVLSVSPVLQRVEQKLAQEARGRALLLARQMVDRNSGFLYEKLESKLDISFVLRERNIKSAFLVDMEGRILAPGSRLNQYIDEPDEAAFSAAARQRFLEREDSDEEKERFVSVRGDILAAAVPVKVFSQASGKNVPVALGIVFFDRSSIMIDAGSQSMAYIQALLLSAIVALLVYFSIYRLTLRPLLALNDGIDQVLKGAAGGVAAKFKMEEINPLLDVVNAALQRVQSSGGGGLPGMDLATIGELNEALKFATSKGGAIMLFDNDRRITFLNAQMEEITGIHSDGALGQVIDGVARDAAFASFVVDILGRAAAAPGGAISEDFEFSGVMFKMECMAVGERGVAKAFVLSALRES